MFVSVILFPGLPLLDYSLTQHVFRTANSCAGRALFDVRYLGANGASVATDIGLDIQTDSQDWTGVKGVDLTMVLAGPGQTHRLPMGLRGYLHAVAKGPATLGGFGGGASILAELGFLDGHAAWLPDSCDPDLPGLRQIALSDRAVCLDRQRLTSAGGIATLDALLRWIARAASPDLANAVAKSLNYPETSPAAPSAGSGDPVLARMQNIMGANLEVPLPLEQIARELDLSPKQMRTRCQNGLGITPLQAYLQIRLRRARKLVMDTELSVQEIALATGFSSPSAFTRSYRAEFGQTPRAVRAARRIAA